MSHSVFSGWSEAEKKSERDNLLLKIIALSFSIGNKSSIVRDFMVLLKIGPSEKFYIGFLAFFQGLQLYKSIKVLKI